MDLELAGRWALVTGASRGIGLACVQSLLREGARVAMVARDPDRLRAVAARLGGSAGPLVHAAADLSNSTETRAAYRHITQNAGVPDIVICAAGAARHQSIENLSDSTWRAAWEAKFLTVMNMVDAVRPDMVERGSGVIVNIIGVGGKVADAPHLTGGAANSALMLATVGLGRALGPRGIRVVGVSPAPVVTDRYYAGRRAYAAILNKTEDEIEQDNNATLPLRRPAQPQEVADVAVFLASARASYVSGVIVQVDGASTAVV